MRPPRRRLRAALDGWDAGRLATSEFFHSYFRAVVAYRTGGPGDLLDSARLLGSILLADAARGALDLPGGSLPVAGEDALRLPSASVDALLPPAPGGGAADPAYVEAHGPSVLAAVEASWLHRGPAARLRGATPAVLGDLTTYVDQTIEVSGLRPDLAVATDAAGAAAGTFDAAYALVADVSPEHAAEVDAVTEYVVPLLGRHFVGGSDITLFGASYLRLDPAWSPLSFADHVLHEAAHQLMHACQEAQPLLLNRDEIGAHSPIRSDPRPLYGTFHATFVFLRLAQFMAGVLESGPAEAHDEARLRLHRHLVGLLQGLEILRVSGKFSEEGLAETAGWVEEARRLSAVDGPPRPELYLALDWDYDPADPALSSLSL